MTLFTLALLAACGGHHDSDASDSDSGTVDSGTSEDSDSGSDTAPDTDSSGDTDASGDTDVEPPADPTAVTITNYSFEQSPGSSGSWTTVAPAGWEFPSFEDANGGWYRPNAAGMTTVEPLASPAHGNSVAWLGAVAEGDPYFQHESQLSASVSTGDTVTARVAVAKRKDKALTGSGSVFIELIPLSMMGMPCTPVGVTFDQLRAAEGTWLEASISCVSMIDINVDTMRFGAYGLNTAGDQLIFDNVRVNITPGD
jgi:hypothetical protein